MNEVKIDVCVCGMNIFSHKDGEQYNKYEDLAGNIQHSEIRCEVNQIVSKQLGQLQIQINQIKERLNL